MTEEEARKTRCCGPQGCGKVQDYDVHRNSVGDAIGQSLLRFCVGSACMAWRRMPKAHFDVRGLSSFGDEKPEKPTADDFQKWEHLARDAGYVPHPDTDHYYGVAVAWAKRDETPRGFCGLAGTP